MRNKYMLIGVGIMVGVLLSSVVFVLAGNVDSPAAPGATNSFTLENIYDRLDTGADGAQSTFTEPGVPPGTGTGHTLNETMAKAPARDDVNGALIGEVENGKTFWGLNVAGGEWGLQTGTADCDGGAGVPKTGDAYNDACCTGEDGELQKGVAWPNPRFTKHGDGTVTDNLTGLMWMQDANAGNDCHGADTGTETWANALASAAACNAGAGFAGYTDWRLPNVRELHSLVHYGVYNPAVPNTAGTGKWAAGDPFDNVQSSYYWSSTTYADGTTSAWLVSLSFGYVSSGGKTGTTYVWPVRGGQ
jgi:hypothetical protein